MGNTGNKETAMNSKDDKNCIAYELGTIDKGIDAPGVHTNQKEQIHYSDDGDLKDGGLAFVNHERKVNVN